MLYRYIFGNDIFVSYARSDGLVYAQGLASELAASGFSCTVDLWDSHPGVRIPAKLRRAVRHSSMMVLIGTGASSQSDAVGQEIQEFLRTGRNLIPIGFPHAMPSAVWYASIAGLPWASEASERLETGTPSAAILSRIKHSFEYTRRTTRLTRAATGAGLLTLAFLVALGGLSSRTLQLTAELTGLNRAIGDKNAELGQARTDLEAANGSVLAQRAEAARQADRAATQRAIADSRSLAAQAMAVVETDPMQSIQLSLAARDTSDTFEARRALLASLQTAPRLAAARFLPFPQPVTAQSLSPTAGVVAFGTARGSIGVMSIDDGMPWPLARSATEDVRAVMRLALAANGDLVASRGREVVVYRGSEATPMTLEGPGEERGPLLFDPSGQKLLFTDDDGEELKLWSLDQRPPIAVGGRDHDLTAAAFSQDGRWLAWGDDNEWTRDVDVGAFSSVFLRDMESGKTLELTRAGRDRAVSSLAFSPDGALLATGWSDGRLILWQVATEQMVFDPMAVSRHERQAIRALAFSPDGRLLASASADRVVVWPMAGAFGSRVSAVFKVPKAGLTQLEFRGDGLSLFGVGGRGLYVWDVGRLSQTDDGPALSRQLDEVVGGFQPDGRTFQAASTGELATWQDSGRRGVQRMVVTRPDGSQIGVCPSCKWSVIRTGDGIDLYDRRSGRKAFRLLRAGADIETRGVSFDRHGRVAALVTASTRQPGSRAVTTASMHDLVGKRTIRVVKSQAELSAPRFSSTGDMLAFRSGGGLRVLSIPTGEWRDVSLKTRESIEASAFSDDDRLLATGGRTGSVDLWDLQTGSPTRTVLQSGADKGIEFGVADLAFDSLTGTLAVAGGGPQNTVSLWNVESRQLLGRLESTALSAIRQVAFSGDGRTLAVLGLHRVGAGSAPQWESRVEFWDVDPSSWAEAGRQALRGLTWEPVP